MDTQQVSKTLFLQLWACFASILLLGNTPAAAEEFSQSLSGDIGMGAYYTHTRSIIRGKGNVASILPYGDFEYGRMFARVDTLGIKTEKIGYGYLELVGRISMDGFNTNTPSLRGLNSRKTSVPLGIGTLQETPLGGFMVNVFHDVRESKGLWLEGLYAAELDLPQVTLYPLMGLEYQSKEYVRYYYGISAQEAANSQYAVYQPSGARNHFIGLIGDIRLSDEYHLNCYVRRKWFGDPIQHSPIVSQSYLDTGYIALSYRFK